MTLFVLFILALQPACQAEGLLGEYESEQVTRRIQDFEEAIRGLSVTNEWTMKLLDDEIAGYVHSAQGTDSVIVECHGSRGRIRCLSRGESVVVGVKGPAGTYRAISVFDGDSVKLMQGGKHYISGIVSQKASSVRWKFDPRLAVTTFFRRTVSDLLDRGDGKITDETTLDGIPVLVMETTAVKKDVERRYRFHVAPSLNFAVVRRAIEAKLLEHDKWLEYKTVQCADYNETTSGIWLPASVIERDYIVEEHHFIEDVEPPLSSELQMKMVDWVVNPKVNDGLFDLEFSAGVRITDRVADKAYQVAGINAAILEKQAKDARTIVQLPKDAEAQD